MEIPDLDELIRKLTERLTRAWDSALSAIINALRSLRRTKELSPAAAILAVKRILLDWPHDVFVQSHDIMAHIFTTSFASGMIDTELNVVPDAGDMQAFDWISHQRNGFLPALKAMAQENQAKIERIITGSYLESGGFDLDKMVREIRDATQDVGKERAELIVRTETAKISALGRIFAWGKDADRDWYNYHWIATHDDRVKDISLVFERQSPYDYDSIKRVWEHDHQEPRLVRNRKTGRMEYQVSAYNCRCSVARSPKSSEQLVQEGKISAFTGR